MKSTNFTYQNNETTVYLTIYLTKDDNNRELVTFIQPKNTPNGNFNVNTMPTDTLAEVYKWVQENSDYML